MSHPHLPLNECRHPNSVEGPIVSVVITAYNQGRFINDAIRSVLQQSCRHFEIIVVDDGSTDDTRAVVEPFADRLRYIYQDNAGVASARNVGLENARGPLVTFLDADDLYEPDFLRIMTATLEKHAQAGAAYCGYRHIDEAGRLLPQIEDRVIPPAQFRATILQGNFVVPVSVMVRRTCFERVGTFDASVGALVDWDMWLRISELFAFVGVGALLARYRVVAASHYTDLASTQSSRLRVVEKHCGPQAAATSDSARRAFAHTYLYATVDALQAGREGAAYEHLRACVQAYPALLGETAPFYELACGTQPRGYHGDFASLDLERSNAWLEGALGRLFADPSLMDGLAPYRRAAYANGHVALGRLSYGARHNRAARRHLLRAVVARPATAFRRSVISTWLRSLVPAKIARIAGTIRRRRAQSAAFSSM